MGRVNELQREVEEELKGTHAVFEEAVMKAREIPETKGFHRLTKEHKHQYEMMLREMEEFFSLLEEYTRGDIL